MRQRRSASVFTPSPAKTYDDQGSDSEQSILDFQASQTEKSAIALLKLMRIVVAFWLPMFTMHIAFNRATFQVVLQALPRLLIWVSLCGRRHYLQDKMKSHPILVASAVQCVGHITVAWGMISTTLYLPEGLVQHRAFLTQWLPMYMLAASNLYLTMPIFLMFVCPLYFITWLIFHTSVGFLTPPGTVWAICLSAVAVYVRHYQTSVLWNEFQAVRALQKERNVSKAMQESFRGILSSIFDASCTCAQSGQLREFSPQLQELLGLRDREMCGTEQVTAQEMTGDLNLCSFAATNAEATRLANFLANAGSGALNQASKIQCSLRRSAPFSTDVFDAHLFAIKLQDYANDQNAADSVFVVLEISNQSVSAAQAIIPDDAGTPSMHSASSISLEYTPHQRVGRHCLSSAIIEEAHALSDEVGSAAGISDSIDRWPDAAALDGSLSYSMSETSANQQRLLTICNAQTQTVSRPTASVGVQTIVSAGKPPLPPFPDEHLQHAFSTGFSEQPLNRNRRRVFSKKRCKTLQSFAATPRDVAREVIVMNVLTCINPVCQRGCCLYHTLLHWLRHEAASMLKSSPCKTWSTDTIEQCASCFTLTDKEDDEEAFVCGFCTNDQLYGHDVSRSSPTSDSVDDKSE